MNILISILAFLMLLCGLASTYYVTQDKFDRATYFAVLTALAAVLMLL